MTIDRKQKLDSFRKIEKLILEGRKIAGPSFDYYTSGRTDPLALENDKLNRLEKIKNVLKKLK